MARRVNCDLLLVGSLPAGSSEEALRAAGELFGDLVFALPDGETGPRVQWIGYEFAQLLAPHRDIEVAPPSGEPRSLNDIPSARLHDGVVETRFERWPRIDDAIESYSLFTALRGQGLIPSDVRFQVGLPFCTSALTCLKEEFDHDFPIVQRAYEELIEREIKRLTAAIPAQDLAIQWDVCTEVLDIEGVISWMRTSDAWERFAGSVRRVTPLIPKEVLVGYHFCYGTFPTWPMYEAQDMELIVRMANYAMEHSGRQVDFVHLAGPRELRSGDDRFFEPLRGLRASEARVFLGIVLPSDGEEGLRWRHATASKYLDDFGVAMYCGFGRQPGQDGRQTMLEHRDVVKAVSATIGSAA